MLIPDFMRIIECSRHSLVVDVPHFNTAFRVLIYIDFSGRTRTGAAPPLWTMAQTATGDLAINPKALALEKLLSSATAKRLIVKAAGFAIRNLQEWHNSERLCA